MPHQIKDLILDEISGDFSVPLENNERRLKNLSKINFFIGPNNSGKSRLIRELSKIIEPTFSPPNLESIALLKDGFVDELKGLFSDRVVDMDSVYTTANALPAYKSVRAGQEWAKPIEEAVDVAIKASGRGVRFIPGVSHAGYQHLIQPVHLLGGNTKTELENLLKAFPEKWDFQRIYVPTLRGLRSFEQQSGDSGDIYEKRTVRDYFKNLKNPPFIATGLKLFSEIKSLLLGNLKDRRIVSSFQDYLSTTFFDSQPVAMIPREGSDVLFIKIGEEEEKAVYDLGDGIQMIVIITFPLFRCDPKKNTLLFLEEPELYLHPGLQRTLITAIGSFDNVQCFIATHSNHLLDLTVDRSDISIYSVKKELSGESGQEKSAKCLIENLSNGDTRILNLIGVRNSSVFLSNCTIWVEGITDRRYIRKFMRLYIQDLLNLDSDAALPFKEDLHYSYIEYGGSNITHWSFLDNTPDPIVVDRLCARLILVADKDGSLGKDSRHGKLERKLGERFVRLDRREIENLLVPDVIISVLRNYEGEGVEFNDISYSAYTNVLLGDFIENKILIKTNRKGGYKEQSGTVRDKVNFCDKALDSMTSISDLSPDAKQLAKRIYEFIKEHNEGP